jgi:hypothetical protein
MKFLCVECDEAMKLQETRAQEKDLLSVIFTCPECRRSIAMLTNAMETQMVRSLDVKLGGRKEAAQPMEMVQKSLAYQNDDTIPSQSHAHSETSERVTQESSSSKCPFTGMVNDAYANIAKKIVWTSEAETRLSRIPEFVRPMVKKSIEQHARDKGFTEINVSVMEELKEIFQY